MLRGISKGNIFNLKTNLKNFLVLCKLRVNSLIVFTAVIGMFLSTPGMVPFNLLLSSILGIGFVSGAAAAFNCLIEQKIDAIMARTKGRPIGAGLLSSKQTVVYATILGGIGLVILYYYVNVLTMWLTLATFFSYSVIYTIFLKPATPMNIVIGGASGAMPPILGWAAVNNTVGPEAFVLFLIIFCWTPPHFWA
jgi:protoheme IX farnesyltransferase